MLREKWNNLWKVTKSSGSPLVASVSKSEEEGKYIRLPHDAMIYETRTSKTKNKHQTGFYPGDIYTYTKKFEAPEEWRNKVVTFEFEGVYMNSKVYINGDYAGGHPYGYTNYYVSANDFLNYGEMNEIKVVANNSAEENSRWYSGSGIYRDVNIIIGDLTHIQLDSTKITTPEVDSSIAVVQIDSVIENNHHLKRNLKLKTTILDKENNIVANDHRKITAFGSGSFSIHQRITLENPQLWDCDTPNLYVCRMELLEDGIKIDEEIHQFGVRTLKLDAKRGLLINDKEVKLRGSCIHHDNGIIGATTLERAEERRCEQLKEAGFNAIRSSHHPLSKAMLRACDRIGMLVIDELADGWTRPKNNNDYTQAFIDHWQKDLEQMIAKDFNHPSVIMYIAGNEIQEAGSAKGAELNRILTEKIHKLDSTRYVSSAVSGLLASMDHMGEIISSITGMSMEKMGEETKTEPSEEPEVGSDAVNSLANVLKGPLADAMATHPIMNELLDEFVDGVDVAGYNYLTARHEIEHNLNPNRVVLGTETFPSDIVRLWKIVEDNPNVIGDMTWTGYDYLGEAGAGVFYYDGRQGFMENWPISIAYLGDIDIIGNRRTISYFREIVYGLRNEPYIAVERLNRYGEAPSESAWIWKDELSSWTWNGYENKPAIVNVYSLYDEVEFFINGRSLGKKKAGRENGFNATYELLYEPGRLEAINYQNGKVVGKHMLQTAEDNVSLKVDVDRKILQANGEDLSYITISLVDDEGNENLHIKKNVTAVVEGKGALLGFGSADPETENSYQSDTWQTYDGKLLAVIRSTDEPGDITVTFTPEDGEESSVVIKTVK